jgi:hypothetical protein
MPQTWPSLSPFQLTHRAPSLGLPSLKVQPPNRPTAAGRAAQLHFLHVPPLVRGNACVRACTACVCAPGLCMHRLCVHAPPACVRRACACTACVRAPGLCMHRLCVRAPGLCVRRLWVHRLRSCMHRLCVRACTAMCRLCFLALRSACSRACLLRHPKPPPPPPPCPPVCAPPLPTPPPQGVLVPARQPAPAAGRRDHVCSDGAGAPGARAPRAVEHSPLRHRRRGAPPPATAACLACRLAGWAPVDGWQKWQERQDTGHETLDPNFKKMAFFARV